MIYEPAEDSYLLESEVRKIVKGKSFLDIGSGSGIQALSALNNGVKSVLTSDINEESVKMLKSKGIKAINSDLFKNIKGKFDLIAFNPPYLPEDRKEDKESGKITTGGKKGDEIILRFIREAKNHLNHYGIILLVVSSLTPKQRIKKLFNSLKLTHKKIAEKKLFFEKLEVWEINEI